MTCPKCIAPKYDGPREACSQFLGFHGFCHACGYAFAMHRGAARIRQPDSDRVRPTLTVIDGGAPLDYTQDAEMGRNDDAPVELDAEARMWSAWVDGEDNR